MTTPSTASTHGLSWGQRLPQMPAQARGALPEVAPLGAIEPPVWVPAGLAADDLPQGKILLALDRAEVALELQRMLLHAGFRVAGPAATLADVQRLIERGSIDCALVDTDLNRRTPLPVAEVLAFADVPFVFITRNGRADVPSHHLHRPTLQAPFDAATLVNGLTQAMCQRTVAANDNRGPFGPGTVRVFPAL